MLVAMPGRSVSPSRAIAVGTAVVMLALAVTSIADRASQPSDGTRPGYVAASLSRDGLGVSPIPGAETPLVDGDRIVAVEGVSLESWLLTDREPPGAGIGDTVAYEVVRDGSLIEIDVPLRAFPLGTILLESAGTVLFVVVTFLMAAYVYARRPHAPGAAPLLVIGSSLVGSSIPWLLRFQAIDVARGAGFWIWLAGAFAGYTVIWSASLHFALVFPRSLPGVRRGAIVAVYLVPLAIITAWIVGGAIGSGSLLEALNSAVTAQLAMVLLTIAAVIGCIGLQYRRATEPRMRQQVRWVAWGSGMALTLLTAGWFLPELLTGGPILPWNTLGLSGLPFPIAVGIAVLRHRLFDIDVVINRTLVYGGLTATVIAVYVGAATFIGSLVPREGSFAASLLATGVAALAALPIRDRLQRAVNRLMYGDRDEPYRAITRLGDRLSASLTTEEILPTVVATVASALRLPYVAIELGSGDVTAIAAATGEPDDRELVRMPLVDQGERIGELIVAPRAPGEAFSRADQRLLAGLAQEAGRAARSVRLIAEVERSRRQLVAGREEERRRLRRDLHDGLGPSVAGARLKVEAARSLAAGRPDAAASLLDELDADLAGLLEEVRRISRGLRPPALDELGLMPALRAQASNFTVQNGLDLRVEGPVELPPLPAAIEAAAYWIALEALTNVSRHSAATHCRVRVRLGDGLEVEVEDDGVGIRPDTPRGVGLTAMRERAAEVGGTFQVEPRSEAGGGGTRVVAHLPLPAGGVA
jgi:two-component system, NarL family, sensor kinase